MLVIVVQHLAAGLGHKDEILNADAEFTGQVDARLNGKDHAGLGNGRVGAAYIALFVVGLADEMAQPVVEVFTIAGRRDQAAGGSVKVAEPHAGLDKGLGGLVGAAHKVMHHVRVISLQ